MSNVFLAAGSGVDLSTLQNGSFAANLATVQDQSLVPGLPVAADDKKRLITRLISMADLAFAIPTTALTSAAGTTLVSDGVGPDLVIKGLTAGPGIELASSATDITIAATGFDENVVPLSIANAVVATNSYDYYFNETVTHNMTIAAMRIAFSSVGADSIRVAIYRGTDLTAVLVGQSASTPPGAAVATVPIVAIVGQNLTFARGAALVIAFAIGGTTTSLRGVTCTSDTTRYWFNTTDSQATGFPTNPRVKGGGPSVIPCCRLISA